MLSPRVLHAGIRRGIKFPNAATLVVRSGLMLIRGDPLCNLPYANSLGRLLVFCLVLLLYIMTVLNFRA